MTCNSALTLSTASYPFLEKFLLDDEEGAAGSMDSVTETLRNNLKI